MGRRSSIGLLGAAVLVAACGAGIASDPTSHLPRHGVDGGSDSGSGAPDGGTSAAWAACSATADCPGPQVCLDGLCTTSCSGDADCPADRYCETSRFGDGLCHPREVPVCPGEACASSQQCVLGLCSTPGPAASCTPRALPADGCDRGSVCVEGRDGPRCRVFPHCPVDGSCPAAAAGSLCNDGLLPQKDRLCIPELCRDGLDCPGTSSCVRVQLADPLGWCSDGSSGSACDDDSRCTSGHCVQRGSGLVGSCL